MTSSSDASEPFPAENKYRDIDSSEDWEARENEDRPRVRYLPWVVSSVLLLLLTNATTYFLVNRMSLFRLVTWADGIAPIIRDVDIKYKTVLFNSTVYGDKDSIYRQKPSREVDEAWNALGVDIAPMIITKDEAIKSGIPRDRVRLDEKDGGPGFPVVVEGLHNLHCLNLLRQALYFNYDKYHEWKEGAWKNEEATLQLHIGHCLNMLRLVLTCNPDTGVHPFVWAKHSNNASYPAHVFPDFQRPHKCKNFNDILQYAKSSKSMTSGTVDILPKKDSLILPDWP
ncbi:protein of unknown function (DUF3328) domain containing protein [Hyaloscypha variabilis]